MRFLLLTLLSLVTCASAPAKLYIQNKSRSPDGSVVFAINYPPIENHPDTYSHDPVLEGCFLSPKSKQRIGNLFYLEGTDAESDHPGTYPFDAYNVFDYVWSADSTRVAIVRNMRHFGLIYPFRRRGPAFQRLQMPDLVAPLQKRLAGTLQQSRHTSIEANYWQPKHRLVAMISRDAQLTNTGNEGRDWREYSLHLAISFDAAGKPTIRTTTFRVGNQ